MLTLASRVAPGAPKLERKELFALVIAVARYVAEAHEEGRTVDDLRPAAIELLPIGTDFAVRRARVVEAPAAESPEAVLARSPEQLREADFVSPTADVYGLGVLVYRLAAGRPPFGGESFHEMLIAIADGVVDPLEQLRPDLGAPLAEAVRRAMATDAALRFRDGREMLAALEEAREAGPISSPATVDAATLSDDARQGEAEAEASPQSVPPRRAVNELAGDDDEAAQAETGRFLLQLTVGLVLVIAAVGLAYRAFAPRRRLPPSTPTAAVEAARSAATELRDKAPTPASSVP